MTIINSTCLKPKFHRIRTGNCTAIWRHCIWKLFSYKFTFQIFTTLPLNILYVFFWWFLDRFTIFGVEQHHSFLYAPPRWMECAFPGTNWRILLTESDRVCQRSWRYKRRALFQHLNFQKCSERGVFCTFWLRHVLRATTARTFSSSQLPKCSEAEVLCTFWLRNALRATTACNFSFLIWTDCSAPAALASLLFDPPEPQII